MLPIARITSTPLIGMVRLRLFPSVLRPCFVTVLKYFSMPPHLIHLAYQCSTTTSRCLQGTNGSRLLLKEKHTVRFWPYPNAKLDTSGGLVLVAVLGRLITLNSGCRG